MTVLVVAAFAVIAVTLCAAVGVVREGVRRHGPGVLVWRWLTGASLSGRLVTDAGWFRPGEKPLTRKGFASRFHHLPRVKRMAWRAGGTVAVILVLAGLALRTVWTLRLLAVAMVAAAGFGCWFGRLAWRRRRHHRKWVRPTHLRLARGGVVPLAANPAYLEIPADRRSAIVNFPPGFDASPKALEYVQRTVTQSLGMESPDVMPHLSGDKPRLVFTESEPPPPSVTFADLRGTIAGAAADELVMGIGKQAQKIKISLSGDSPHLGFSMGSGAGKSVTARLIAAQCLHNGALVLFLDYKLISHNWARGLPNVAYAAYPGEIHKALIWLADEIQRRNDVALRGADIEGEVHANVGPRILVVAEELNATMARLKSFWRDAREKGDPSTSPAISALEEILCVGRQVQVNVLMIGQRLSAKASGGGDARENLAVRVLSRHTAATWKMLAPEHPMPPASGHTGRVQVVTASAVRETQVGFMTGREARQFATSGQVAIPRSDMPYVTVGGPVSDAVTQPGPNGAATVSDPRSGQEIAVRETHVSDEPAPVQVPVSLSDAVAAGAVYGMTLRALQMARWRDKRFPKCVALRGQAKLYDAAELAAYAARKHG